MEYFFQFTEKLAILYSYSFSFKKCYPHFMWATLHKDAKRRLEGAVWLGKDFSVRGKKR